MIVISFRMWMSLMFTNFVMDLLNLVMFGFFIILLVIMARGKFLCWMYLWILLSDLIGSWTFLDGLVLLFCHCCKSKCVTFEVNNNRHFLTRQVHWWLPWRWDRFPIIRIVFFQWFYFKTPFRDQWVWNHRLYTSKP